MKKLFCCLILFMTALLCFADEKFEKVKAAAEQGDAFAQFSLAVMYDKGIEALVDKKQAVYWYTKSAEQGYDMAQLFLAVMYYNGEGTLVDKKQAFYWYTKAAEQGDAAAQLNLALMYYAGEGTLPDKTKAAYWVKQAYENGLDKAKEFWETYELWKYQE